jgi:four helix bundle protein
MIESYRDLAAWQKAMDLVENIYALTARLPEAEKFGLAMQLRRAAVSIPSTIAEGHARASTREFSRYVSIARGSLAEVETQVLLAQRLVMIDRDISTAVLSQCDEQGRMLRGLKKALDNKIAGRDRQRALAPNPSSLIPRQ